MPDRSTLTGTVAALEGLARLKRQVPAAMGDGLVAGAEVIAQQSDIYCPKKTKALVQSRKISEPETDGGKVVVEISYGGPDAPYAPYAHEMTTYKHPAPTQAKFLERAAQEKKDEVTQAIGQEISLSIETAKNGSRSIG